MTCRMRRAYSARVGNYPILRRINSPILNKGGYHLIAQIVLLIHILLKHILQPTLQLERFGEVVVARVEHSHEENAVAVLRYAIILTIEYLRMAGVAHTIEGELPLVEELDELRPDKRSHILHEGHGRSLGFDGSLAFPKERGTSATTFLATCLLTCIAEILARR